MVSGKLGKEAVEAQKKKYCAWESDKLGLTKLCCLSAL